MLRVSSTADYCVSLKQVSYTYTVLQVAIMRLHLKTDHEIIPKFKRSLFIDNPPNTAKVGHTTGI